ncbi:MAG: ABC transporter ATP-binding protein [Candidatus Kapaibacteriota bacterium]|jgi:heme exporter protein A
MLPLAAFHLRADNLTQRFNRRRVWHDISLEVRNGDILGITGDNGSGKTTLLRALCGLLTPTSGKITFSVEEKVLDNDLITQYCGFVAPYLTLYEEFTPLELCSIIAQMRGVNLRRDHAEHLFEHFRLLPRRADEIRGFSSGMKQRMKYVLAFLFDAPLLVLDEPMTNLDEHGMNAVEELVKHHRQRGGTCIIATNDARDLALCTHRLSVTDYLD